MKISLLLLLLLHFTASFLTPSLSLAHPRPWGTRCFSSFENLRPDVLPENESEVNARIDSLVKGDDNIVLFMKGTKMFPQCGFSNTAVQVSSCRGSAGMTVFDWRVRYVVFHRQ